MYSFSVDFKERPSFPSLQSPKPHLASFVKLQHTDTLIQNTLCLSFFSKLNFPRHYQHSTHFSNGKEIKNKFSTYIFTQFLLNYHSSSSLKFFSLCLYILLCFGWIMIYFFKKPAKLYFQKIITISDSSYTSIPVLCLS